MPIDQQEQFNEFLVEYYNEFLCSLTKGALLAYFIEMEIKTLVEFIKEEGKGWWNSYVT